jgi:hypothetical protein
MSKHDTSMTRKRRPSTGYAVGYKKPPAATRFQPGKSGNPKGRPKGGGAAIEDAIFKVMDEPFVVTEGGKRRRMPAVEAILRGLRTKAMNGDVKAASFLIDFLIEQKEKHPDPDKRTLEDLTRDLTNHFDQMSDRDRTNLLNEMSYEKLLAIARYGGPDPEGDESN